MALPSDGWKPGTLEMLAEFFGPFHATIRNGAACAWLGTSGQVYLWPAGYGVRFHPTELIDPQGHVVAREGQVVSIGGGSVPVQPGEQGKKCISSTETKSDRKSVAVLEGLPHVGKAPQK